MIFHDNLVNFLQTSISLCLNAASLPNEQSYVFGCAMLTVICHRGTIDVNEGLIDRLGRAV